MSTDIPMSVQGELVVRVGVAANKKQYARKGKKEGEKIGVVSIDVMALGSKPLQCRADVDDYQTGESNPLAVALSKVVEGEFVAVVGRNRVWEGQSFFEAVFVHTDPQWIRPLCGLVGAPLPEAAAGRRAA